VNKWWQKTRYKPKHRLQIWILDRPTLSYFASTKNRYYWLEISNSRKLL
jgi:hypothetical protein